MKEIRVEIHNLEVEEIENPGCNNGNYPTWTGTVLGTPWHGQTCNCRQGCNGLDHLEFDELWNRWHLVQEVEN